MQVRIYSKKQDGFLEREVRGKSESRSSPETGVEAHGLASHYNLGMSGCEVAAKRYTPFHNTKVKAIS